MLTHTHTFEFYLVHNVSTVIFYWTLSEVPAVTWKAKIMEKKHSPNMGNDS